MVYMGFDFGTQSWGVAIGNEISGSSEALGAVRALKGRPNWEEIKQLVIKWNPEGFVIGYPLKLSGERFALTDKVDQAIVDLQAVFPQIPIHKADERLTTVEAKEDIFSKKGRKGLIKGAVDAESAKLILLGWFERRAFDIDGSL